MGQLQAKPYSDALAIAETQRLRVGRDGCAIHLHLNRLTLSEDISASRDLADAVHLLCQIHGRHPTLVELALAASPAGRVRDFLRLAVEKFEQERLYLVHLTAAVGPLPSTPGAEQTESALLNQRRALETLAGSERRGCAIGAATALLLDWPALRPALDRAARRANIAVIPHNLPDENEIEALLADEIDGPGPERALNFGTEQMLLQTRGLVDLLEARALARDRVDGIL